MILFLSETRYLGKFFVVKKDVTLIDRSKPSGFSPPPSSPPAAKKENYFFPRFHIADMRDEIANSREISQKEKKKKQARACAGCSTGCFTTRICGRCASILRG